MTLFEGIERFGDAPALIFADAGVLSYRAMTEQAAALVERLGARRQLVVIEMRNALEPILAYLGAARAGHPVILTGAGGAATLDAFAPFWLFAESAQGWDWTAPKTADAGLSLHPDLALMLATSGSTGSSKLVRLSAQAVAANARSIAEYLAIDAAERAITSLPLTYSYGASVLHSHLLAGASVCVTDEPITSDAFWAFFRQHGCTSFAGVPYSYAMLERRGFRDDPPPTLRTLTQAGGRMPPELVSDYTRWSKRQGIRFFVMYGQTEATARIAYLPLERAETHADCIGIAIPGGALSIAPIEGQPAGRGELVYRGPNVMMGYATERSQLAHPAELEVLHTGDIAEQTEDGLFRIVGRMSRFSKIGGKRIALDDLEQALATAGRPGVIAGDDELIAVWTREPEGQDPAELIVDRFGLPRSAVIWAGSGETPRLTSGKTDYQQILTAARLKAEARRAGATSLAATLAAILGRREIDAGRSFDALGGDSLAYVQASIAVEEALGALPDDWTTRPVAELETLADPREATGWRSIPTEILVRAIAACAVVIGHTPGGSMVKGGALTLFLLTGYSLATHQRGRLFGDRPWRIPLDFAANVLLPFYLLMFFVMAISKDADLTLDSVLLVSNLTGRERGPLMPYWFLETMIQCLVVLAALLSVSPLRRIAQRTPLAFFAGLTGLSIAAHFAVPLVWEAPRIAEWPRSPDAWGYLLPLGCTMALARAAWQRAALIALAVGIIIHDYGADNTRAVFVATMFAAILFVPRVRLPVLATKALMALAGASLFIYLVHMLAIQVTVHELGIDNPLPSLALSLVLGWIGHRVWNWVLARVRARRAWDRSPALPDTGS